MVGFREVNVSSVRKGAHVSTSGASLIEHTADFVKFGSITKSYQDTLMTRKVEQRQRSAYHKDGTTSIIRRKPLAGVNEWRGSASWHLGIPS